MLLTLAFIDSPKDWLVIGLIVLLLFGGAKIPELARSLGRAKAEFNKASKEAETTVAAENEDEKVRRMAKEMGVQTEGRATQDIRKDLAAKVATNGAGVPAK